MSSRQARRERRAAERKAKKVELKRAKAAAAEASSIEIGFVSQNDPNLGSAEAPVADEPAGLSEAKSQAKIGFVSQSSTKRAQINRANAQHSTGPRSEAGKLASSCNSLKHGLASGTSVVDGEAHSAFVARCAPLGEDPAAFEALKAALFAEHQPASDTEALLVTEMAQSWWLTQRAIRLQNECFTETGIDEKRLALFLRYQTAHDRAFHKALNTLIRLKKDRFKAEGGFVSQKPPRVTSQSGFVSQNGSSVAPERGFVSQNPDEFSGFAPDAAKKDAA